MSSVAALEQVAYGPASSPGPSDQGQRRPPVQTQDPAEDPNAGPGAAPAFRNTSKGGLGGKSTSDQAMLSGADKTTRPGSSTDEQVAALVRELFMRAREARRQVMSQWRRNYRILNNRYYRPGNSPWEEEPAVSSIWPTVASACAWMTDQRPTIEVTPTAEAFSPYWDFYNKLMSDMNTCINAVFQTHALDGEVSKSLWDVYTYGIGYFKTVWEPWLAEGLGDAVFRRVDPFTIYPDPHASSPEDLTYIIEAKIMTVAEADRTWPGAANKIASTPFLEPSDEAPHKLDEVVNAQQPRVALGALAPATTPSYAREGLRSANQPTDSPLVTVLEAWIRGYILEPTDDPDVTRVADDWRCVVICGNQVLMDYKASEVNAFDSHPYDRIVLFDTGEWYGPCMVEFLAPIQRIINWILMAINRNIYLMGNPVLVEDMRSASRNKRFTNKPGQRLEGSLNNVGWMNPPQPHPQMTIDLVQYYESKIETISGLSAMVRGFAPSGRNAQGVLDSVQDAAFVRVRASLRELERALRGVATKIAASIAEFYTEPRLQSIIGQDGQHMHLALQARHFYTPPEFVEDENGQVTEKIGSRIPLRFSLSADAGSQLPTSKQARAAEAKHLFTIGAIDIYELLRAISWPSYALVTQRMMQQQAMAGNDDKKGDS